MLRQAQHERDDEFLRLNLSAIHLLIEQRLLNRIDAVNRTSQLSPPRLASRANQRGFTLIELLVVVVIIGIIVTMATVSVSVLGRDTGVEDEAKRLYNVLTQVREEAELQGRDFGLMVEADGYLFMRYDYAKQQWLALTDDDLLAYRKLPKGLQFKLRLDSREVILKSHSENQTTLSSAVSSNSSSAASSISSTMGSPTAVTPTAITQGLRPQISVLSSGDIVPFELQVARDNSDFHWRVTGGADNTLNIDSGTGSR